MLTFVRSNQKKNDLSKSDLISAILLKGGVLLGACQNSVDTPDHGSDKGTDPTDKHPNSSNIPSIENLETSAGLDGKIFNFSLKEALTKGLVVGYFFPSAYIGGCDIGAHTFAEINGYFTQAGG